MGQVRSLALGFVAASLVLGGGGCSGSGDGGGGGRGPRAGNGGGTGGSMAPSGTGGVDFGSGPGGPAMMIDGGPREVPPPPVIDASAPPFVRDDTPMSGVDQGTIDMLKQGGGSCSVTVTYPYEGTLFPGGLPAPIIMWQGASDTAYVRFTYDGTDKVDYQFAARATNELQIPREAWNEITRRTNNAALKVVLSTSSGGAISTCELHWRVAPGNMIGAVYYNTYQAPSGVMNQGAVMRLSLGSTAEVYKQHTGAINLIAATGPCYSCHSVSFDGTTLVASYHDYTAKVFRVEKFDVDQNVQPPPSGMVHNANFGALTPDGDRILAMGNPECTGGSDTFPRKPGNMPLVEGPDVARVLDTATGMDTGAQGLDPAKYMWMPQFSPDGDMVVFNHAKPGGSGTDRTELGIMDYDYATNTFSNLRVIVSASTVPGTGTASLPYAPASALAGIVPCGVGGCPDPTMCMNPFPPAGDPAVSVGALPMGTCDGPCYPAWPFFTPDGRGVVFSLVSEPDFANAFPGRDKPSVSNLWYVDVETLEVVRLEKANKGLQPADELANYYPTVMPVAVGGYFWMFWTAVRDYGHKVDGSRDPGALPNSVLEAHKKRIWVTAIKPRIDSSAEVMTTPGPLTDPSFPGFYLEGQSESGNVRAFAALNPCLANDQPCASGLDCCCGYCLVSQGEQMGKCSCEVPQCSKVNEKCDTSDDCCPPLPGEPKALCIGGYCGFLIPE